MLLSAPRDLDSRAGAVLSPGQCAECTTAFSILSRISQLIFSVLCFGVVISCRLIGFEQQQGAA